MNRKKVPRRKRRILSVSKRAVTIGDNVDKDIEVGGDVQGLSSELRGCVLKVESVRYLIDPREI
jgi:hypothetical protein